MNQKFALVTGASTGIGKALVSKLLEEGYIVGGVARRVDLINSRTVKLQCDLANIDSINKLISEIKVKTNHIDVIVNIAGIWHQDDVIYADKNFANLPQKVILDTYNVGFTAPTLLVHGLLPLMKSESAILNLSGTFENGAKGWLPYFASKRALEDFTLGLSQELENTDIKVLGISPSDTATEEYSRLFPEDAKDANSKEFVAETIYKMLSEANNGEFWVIKKNQIFKEGFHE